MSAHFHTTRWSVVTRSAAADQATASRALGELCEQYWFPLYAHARRSGRGDDEARDLVQAFCAQLLEHGGLDGATPARGRFRHYLLGAFTHFAHNAQRAERREKRGGAATTWAWHAAAERYALEAHQHDGPEAVFERRWAFAVLDRAMARLAADHDTPARRELWQALQPALLADDDRERARAIAARLRTTEGAVRVALHRMRARWREFVRDEVAQTVVDPADVDDELLALQAALAWGRPEPPA